MLNLSYLLSFIIEDKDTDNTNGENHLTGVSDMSWEIVPQTVTVKGVEMNVDVKNVQYYPKQTENGLRFGRLSHPYLRVIVRRDTWKNDTWEIKFYGNRYSIVYSRVNDPINPKNRGRYIPGKGENNDTSRVVVNEDKNLSPAAFQRFLTDRIKDPIFAATIMRLLTEEAVEDAA